MDDPPNCDFYSASVVDKGPIRIAISTNGGFPGISKVLRKALEIVLPDTDKDSFQKLFGIRKKLQETITNSKERSKVLKEVIATIEEKYFQLKSLEELNKNGRDT